MFSYQWLACVKWMTENNRECWTASVYLAGQGRSLRTTRHSVLAILNICYRVICGRTCFALVMCWSAVLINANAIRKHITEQERTVQGHHIVLKHKVELFNFTSRSFQLIRYWKMNWSEQFSSIEWAHSLSQTQTVCVRSFRTIGFLMWAITTVSSIIHVNTITWEICASYKL